MFVRVIVSLSANTIYSISSFFPFVYIIRFIFFRRIIQTIFKFKNKKIYIPIQQYDGFMNSLMNIIDHIIDKFIIIFLQVNKWKFLLIGN